MINQQGSHSAITPLYLPEIHLLSPLHLPTRSLPPALPSFRFSATPRSHPVYWNLRTHVDLVYPPPWLHRRNAVKLTILSEHKQLRP